MSHATRSALVRVLLSTHDGERWVREQIDSLLAQTHTEWELDVRDDGSRDATPEIVEAYARRDPRIRLARGENIGVVRSFFALLADARPAAYYALCDQDDVWRPEKLGWAVEALERLEPGRPALYASRLELVGAGLEHLGWSRAARRPGFRNALVENVATGCTVVVNAEARRVVLERLPERAIMHDWWLYLVVAAFGSVSLDRRAGVRYRQHGANVVGAGLSPLDELRRRWRRFRSSGPGVFRATDQAAELLRRFGDRLAAPERRVLERFLRSRGSPARRLAYAATKDVYRDRRLDDALLRVLIAIGRY